MKKRYIPAIRGANSDKREVAVYDACMQHEHLSLAYARILFRHLRLDERSGQALFAGTDLDYQGLMALDARVPFATQRQLFRNALQLAEEDHLGLAVGRRLHLSSHGPLGVAAFSSPDLGTALQCLARYSRLRAQFVDLKAQLSGDSFIIAMHEPLDLGDIRRFLHESVISAIYSAIEFFAGGAALKGNICFGFATPDYAEVYSDYFAMPCCFGEARTQMQLHRSLLALPSPVADPELHAQALAQCEAALKSFSDDISLSDQVRELISRNPGKLWTCDDVARELNMSARTLIRRLKTENLSFQAVRDQEVMALAKQYLLDPKMTVELTGHLLGYGDVASFRRSFKRVVGMTPLAYVERSR
ncbi:MAG: AraC family transcriptional regulator [Oleiphilaceae bacterium]|nr:AraC family transcriptional regulator [Oleiphilaceae bacterium]